MTGQKMAPICRSLGISRACAYRESVGRPAHYARAEDRVVTAQIRTVIRTRASYGARRVRALVNREFATRYNLKRIQRVMELNGWKLPRTTRRRTGRAHRGLIQRPVSNERWCSDVLEIACWNGEIVQVGFVTTVRCSLTLRRPGISVPRISSSSCNALSPRASAPASGRTRQSSG